MLLAACQSASAVPFETPPPGPAAAVSVEIPHATMTYYDVSGTTADELRTQLNAVRPTAYDGSKGDAVTTWHIHWDWPGYGTSSCNLSAATVSYDVEVEFPHWVEPDDPDPGLVSEWTTYTRNLATHEEGHVDYVVDHYESVAEAIKGATCTTAEAAAEAALNPIRRHDLDYDADTDHGATQGAIFP
jgi:predicted secreted Zn-dependent protease